MSLWTEVFVPPPPYFPALLVENGFRLLVDSFGSATEYVKAAA